MTSPLAEKFLSLGVALHREFKFRLAEDYYRQALDLEPSHEQARILLAESLREQGRVIEALPLLEGLSSAQALNSRGMILAGQGRLAEALPVLSEAVKHAPTDPDPLVNLALLVVKMSRAEEAMNYFLAALKLAPTHVGALSGLGLLERDLRHFENAALCLRRALEQAPGRADLWNNLGLIEDERGNRVEAEKAYRRCLAIDPDHAQAMCNLGMALLSQGRLAEGFAAYEARWRLPSMPPRPFSQPQWQGESLSGKTILLHAEQCLGDTLHFCRFAPLVKQAGAKRVILEVQPALKALMQGLKGVDAVLAKDRDPLPDFDLHCPLLSLPKAFATDLPSVPSDTPYLSVDPALCAAKKAWLGHAKMPIVGIAWQGNAKFRGEDWRTPGLAAIAKALRSVPGIKFVCLQAGGRVDFLTAFEEQALDLGQEVDAETPPFIETAALMTGLDLVISSDTSVPHLAGALGRPTWLLLPEPAEWRWLEQRADTPWYLMMRLFRQPSPGDWGSALADMAGALEDWRRTCA